MGEIDDPIVDLGPDFRAVNGISPGPADLFFFPIRPPPYSTRTRRRSGPSLPLASLTRYMERKVSPTESPPPSPRPRWPTDAALTPILMPLHTKRASLGGHRGRGFPDSGSAEPVASDSVYNPPFSLSHRGPYRG